jgi:hypothetical protein
LVVHIEVFENKVLGNLFGPMRNEITEEWRRLHKEELCAMHFSPLIFRVIKSRRLRCKGHVARMGDRRVAYRVLVGKP